MCRLLLSLKSRLIPRLVGQVEADTPGGIQHAEMRASLTGLVSTPGWGTGGSLPVEQPQRWPHRGLLPAAPGSPSRRLQGPGGSSSLQLIPGFPAGKTMTESQECALSSERKFPK